MPQWRLPAGRQGIGITKYSQSVGMFNSQLTNKASLICELIPQGGSRGRVAELAYAHGSEPCLARGEGSTPSSSTKNLF